MIQIVSLNMTRKYELRKRAERQQRTRQRIVDAAVELHQSKGIAATTINDVAERAKVGRVTVYRHFPDEMTLARACSAQYFEDHPFPDIESWKTISDPMERLRTGLRTTYAYHRETCAMMRRVLADARDHPVVEPYHARWRRAAEILADAWPAAGRERDIRLAAISLAVRFDTWRALAIGHGLDDDEVVELMARMVGCEA